MKRVLFIASHRINRAPGQRFRFEQYFTFLSKNGFECDLSYLVSAKDDSKIYQRGNYSYKLYFFLKSIFIRIKNIQEIDKYDIVFIFREALMTKSIFFEKYLHKKSKKLIFDFDDSIWLENVSNANSFFKWMKNPDKTKTIIEYSTMIFAGNKYLANYASKYNKNVKIVPTTIDTLIYKRTQTKEKSSLIIGWSGSITTIKHFEFALPFLKKIKEKYGDSVSIKVIGDKDYFNKDLEIIGLPWNKETELSDLSSFDIGIMPLPNDEWSKGKCGLKGLQYMSLGIPTLMSPVGVNSEIIEDGVNGFLCDHIDEWVDRISQLIESPELRNKIGANGKQSVETKYSVNVWKHKYLNYFESLLNE